MKHSAFWTYLFSLCPGAGQMYQGYMKRGLSLILLFVIPFMVAVSVMPAVLALAAVVYMYSFFDSINLRAQLMDPSVPNPKDDYLVHVNVGNELDLKRLLGGRNHLIGWIFVGLGVVGVYKSFVSPILEGLIRFIENEWIQSMLWNALYNIPGVAMGVVFVLVGVWLIKGSKPKTTDFEEYKGEAE